MSCEFDSKGKAHDDHWLLSQVAWGQMMLDEEEKKEEMFPFLYF